MSIINSPTSSGEPVLLACAAQTDDPIGWSFATITTRTPGKAGKPDEIETEIKRDSKPEVEEFLARARTRWSSTSTGRRCSPTSPSRSTPGTAPTWLHYRPRVRAQVHEATVTFVESMSARRMT